MVCFSLVTVVGPAPRGASHGGLRGAGGGEGAGVAWGTAICHDSMRALQDAAMCTKGLSGPCRYRTTESRAPWVLWMGASHSGLQIYSAGPGVARWGPDGVGPLPSPPSLSTDMPSTGRKPKSTVQRGSFCWTSPSDRDSGGKGAGIREKERAVGAASGLMKQDVGSSKHKKLSGCPDTSSSFRHPN